MDLAFSGGRQKKAVIAYLALELAYRAAVTESVPERTANQDRTGVIFRASRIRFRRGICLRSAIKTYPG